jgi:hypothetical protein
MTDRNTLYRLLRPPYRLAKKAVRPLVRQLPVLRTLLKRELTTGTNVAIPLRRRLWLYRHGFTSRSDALFDLDEGNYREFVSDLQHERADDINEPWDAVVNNKLAFHLLFDGFSTHLPACYGVLDGGVLRRTSPAATAAAWEERTASEDEVAIETIDATAWVERYLETTEALVLKPIYGQGGQDVLVCRREANDGYRVNGEVKTTAEFETLVDDLEEYLACEFVDQADYAADLYGDSTNTLRILSLWDYDRDEPFVSGVVHRIGTDESAPVDNWSRGGLSAELREDGTATLSSGAQWLPDRGEVRWYETHPDTGTRIEGARVPGWPAVRERIVEMAAAFPYLPRLGWDVVLTDDEGGFRVLEVNAHAATRTLQVHRPLLRDPRVRRFYEYHGCV